MNIKKRIAIIGGGLLGLSCAYKLLFKNPNLIVEVFEKETKVGMHQSGRNSGVLHCGLYYQPGSLKAKLAVEGIAEMTQFCQQHNINHDICGKIVIASNEVENKTLNQLATRGKENGLKGLTFLTKDEVKKREPYVTAANALLVPQEGIVDYKAVMNKLIELIKLKGGEVHFNSKIETISENNENTVILRTQNTEKQFDNLINCTGLFSDRIFKKFTNNPRPLRIIPFRGEYLKFKAEHENIVNHLIYPVPDIKYPFLGIHFTRLVSGEREVGPNAVLAFKREGYSNTDFSMPDTIESITYKGFVKFIGKNFTFAMSEFSSSFFMTSFINKARKIIPDINETMLEKGTAGVRAQAMDSSGKLIMDFRIERINNQVHVLNAPSPGATSSLAIASYIIENYLMDLN